MADGRPILFSTPMVLALLAGTKTQTRRLVKLPTKTFSGGPIYERADMGGWEATTVGGGGCFTIGKNGEHIPAPEVPAIWHRTTGVCAGSPYAVGDLLYVRETWRKVPATAYRMSEGVQQVVNPDDPVWAAIFCAGWDRSIPKWKPGIHMPRWASRLTLEVTDVRIQRLQDISEADAIAEGLYKSMPDQDDLNWFRDYTIERGGSEPTAAEWEQFKEGVWMVPGVPQGWGLTPAERRKATWGPTPEFCYRLLWEHINGKDSWSANPWVWAVSFKVHQANVDAVIAARAT
jgi:hypothetical protein